MDMEDAPQGKHCDLRIGDFVVRYTGRAERVGRITRYFGEAQNRDFFEIGYPSGKTRIVSHLKLDPAGTGQIAAFLEEEAMVRGMREITPEADGLAALGFR